MITSEATCGEKRNQNTLAIHLSSDIVLGQSEHGANHTPASAVSLSASLRECRGPVATEYRVRALCHALPLRFSQPSSYLRHSLLAKVPIPLREVATTACTHPPHSGAADPENSAGRVSQETHG